MVNPNPQIEPAWDDNPTNIHLTKKIYGLQGALHVLDEKFKEFALKKKSPDEFFTLYNKFFYDLKRNTHLYFLKQCIERRYPEGYVHPREQELIDLESQLRTIQRQIDSIEREHFFFKNHSIMMAVDNEAEISSVLSTVGDAGPFYMHSGKKRKITNLDTYFKLKTRINKYKSAEMSDKEFIIGVNHATMNAVSEGPDINTMDDIYVIPLKINIYPRTLEEYENTDIAALLYNQEISKNPTIATSNRED